MCSTCSSLFDPDLDAAGFFRRASQEGMDDLSSETSSAVNIYIYVRIGGGRWGGRIWSGQEEELQGRERVDDFAVENCWEDLAMPKLAHWLSGSAISIPTHGSFCSIASCPLLVGNDRERKAHGLRAARQELKDLAQRTCQELTKRPT
jgi:hypothetical protein